MGRLHVPHGPRPRDRRPRDGGRRRGCPLQARRPGRRRRPGRLLPRLRQLQGRPGELCVKGFVGTYNAKGYDGAITYGGYANNIVCDMRYVHTISPKFGDKLSSVAPLLCAGITTYSPLRHWGAGPGKKVGIVGLGGLGHMGLKFAHYFGAHAVPITTSASKIADAKRLGADEVVISKDADAMAKHAASFDFISNTSPPRRLDACLKPLEAQWHAVLSGLYRRSFHRDVLAPQPSFTLAGSKVGGMGAMQESWTTAPTTASSPTSNSPRSTARRGLRARGEERCEVQVCDRHGDAEGLARQELFSLRRAWRKIASMALVPSTKRFRLGRRDRGRAWSSSRPRLSAPSAPTPSRIDPIAPHFLIRFPRPADLRPPLSSRRARGLQLSPGAPLNLALPFKPWRK